MESIGVRELRQDASRYLARVEAGESFQVTSRGRPVAVLAPTDARQDARARLIAEGKLIRSTRAWVFPKRGKVDWQTRDVLDEERADRL